jgi:hypothetical protein
MTENENEQLQASTSRSPSIWGTQEAGQCHHYGDGDQFIGSDGIADPDQPFGVGGAIGEGNCQREQLEGETGSSKKLIDQLEEFFSGYLAYVESHEERLKARLNANHEQQKVMKDQFENLKQSLLQLVQESE